MQSTTSPEEYLSLGKAEYKSKRYDTAIDAFSRGLKNDSPVLTLVLLDARAATYEKLSDLKSALKDGRQMIKTVRSDARGYLRSGRILQAMEKEETALNIYGMGLRNVDIKEKEFALLQRMHDRLTLKLSPPRSIDPWTILPIELVEYVIGYIGFRQMVRCMRVSKGWNRFLKSVPGLWMDLDLRFAKRTVGKKFVRSAILNSQRRIRTASLHRFADNDMLQALARTCKQLDRLEFIDCTFGHASIIDAVALSRSLKTLNFGPSCEISSDTITQVLRHCSSLKELLVYSFHESPYPPFWDYDLPQLEKFVLNARGSPTIVRLNFGSFIQRVKNLRILELRGFQRTLSHSSIDLTSLDYLDRLVVYSSFSLFTNIPPSLRSLEVDIEPEDEAAILVKLGEYPFPRLEELHVHGGDFTALIVALRCVIMQTTAEARKKKNCVTRLKSLSFDLTESTTRPFSDESFNSTLSLCRPFLDEVEDFGITGLNMQDRHVESLPKYFPNLRRLNLSRCSNITGVAVKSLISGFNKPATDNISQLMYINLDFCESVSPDATAWARSQGIEISHSFAQSLQSGKRVRYGY